MCPVAASRESELLCKSCFWEDAKKAVLEALLTGLRKRQEATQYHFILFAASEYACSISWSAGHVLVNSSRAYALFRYLQMPVISEGNSKSLYFLATI